MQLCLLPLHAGSIDIFALQGNFMTRFIFVLSLLLSGCATSSTGALPAGPDIYVVARQAGAFPSGREPLLAEALAEAGTKCVSLGRAVKLISTTENPGPYILGNYPKATVIFSCS